MILRSMLFVPADSERKLEKGRGSNADALILDLEDSVAAPNRPRARELLREFATTAAARPSLWVRINPVGSADCADDLDAVIAAKPAGIVVPKPDSPDVLRALDRELSARERAHGLTEGAIHVIPVATETPAAVLSLFEYRKPPPRLEALTWGAEDLSASLEFFSGLFGPPVMKTLTVAPIPGTFGQGFPGLVYLSTFAYIEPAERPVAMRNAREQSARRSAYAATHAPKSHLFSIQGTQSPPPLESAVL